jgi:hypothetical protein
MMQTVETRTDNDPTPDPAKICTQICMLQALHHPGQHHDHDVLGRRDTDKNGQQGEQSVAQQVVQKVIAVIAPIGHVTLRVMQAVQRPPPVQAMLHPVDPVVSKVENHNVRQETQPGVIAPGRPGRGDQRVRAQWREPLIAQKSFDGIDHRLPENKRNQTKTTESMQQGVHDVGAYFALSLRSLARVHLHGELGRPTTFRRPQHQPQQH